METHERVIDSLSVAILIIVGVLGILVSILDFIGADLVSGPWKWLKGPQPVILLTVAALALALGLERYVRFRQIDRQLDSIGHLVTESPEQIIRSLDGVSVRRFADSRELFEYVAERTRTAKRTIDDLTLGPANPELTAASKRAFEKYVENIAVVCSKETIAYREVMSIPPIAHLERAETMLSRKLFGYRLRYYEFTHGDVPPRLGFMIIDAEEVIFGFYRSPFLPTDREIQLAVRHPDIVRLFQDYYDTIWHGARVLKEGSEVRKDVLEDLRKRLKQQ